MTLGDARATDKIGKRRKRSLLAEKLTKRQLDDAAQWLAELNTRWGIGPSQQTAELAMLNLSGGGDARLASWTRPSALKWLRDRGCHERTAHRLLNEYGPAMARVVWTLRETYRDNLQRLKDLGIEDSTARKRLGPRPKMLRPPYPQTYPLADG